MQKLFLGSYHTKILAEKTKTGNTKRFWNKFDAKPRKARGVSFHRNKGDDKWPTYFWNEKKTVSKIV